MTCYTFVGLLGLGLVAIVFGKVTGTGLFDSGVLSAVMIGISAVIVIIFGRIMTAKSLAGAQTWVQVKGFQEFMNRVDADRLRRMPPDTFEKFLAFAMALGVEEQWAKAFAGIMQQPPTWYTGPSYQAFNTWAFTRNLGVMTSTAHSTFVSAPRASSSGSGFSSGGGSGGGSSGGGFGGGGGGAF